MFHSFLPNSHVCRNESRIVLKLLRRQQIVLKTKSLTLHVLRSANGSHT